jgi:hypothetical protein
LYLLLDLCFFFLSGELSSPDELSLSEELELDSSSLELESLDESLLLLAESLSEDDSSLSDEDEE